MATRARRRDPVHQHDPHRAMGRNARRSCAAQQGSSAQAASCSSMAPIARFGAHTAPSNEAFDAQPARVPTRTGACATWKPWSRSAGENGFYAERGGGHAGEQFFRGAAGNVGRISRRRNPPDDCGALRFANAPYGVLHPRQHAHREDDPHHEQDDGAGEERIEAVPDMVRGDVEEACTIRSTTKIQDMITNSRSALRVMIARTTST